jgi:hypothetical protein
MLTSLLSNPVIQFVLLGAGVFWLHSASVQAERLAQPENIVLDPRYIDRLEQELAATLMRKLEGDERQKILDRIITEEVLFREAMNRELDRGDAIIRRHLIQKMEFLLEARSKPDMPQKSDLVNWWEGRRDDYREDERISFRQVFFLPGSDRQAAFATMLEKGYVDPQRAVELGDHFLNGHQFYGQRRVQINGLFGQGFAEQLREQDRGSWIGPLQSIYGEHYVYISEFLQGRQLSFEEAYGQVYTDLVKHLTEQRREQAIDEMRQRYTVITIDGDDVVVK